MRSLELLDGTSCVLEIVHSDDRRESVTDLRIETGVGMHHHRKRMAVQVAGNIGALSEISFHLNGTVSDAVTTVLVGPRATIDRATIETTYGNVY